MLGEPTNDLDIETLTVVEDFLDQWPGTLVVVSHDRYFLERVTDSVWALLGDGKVSMLPGGVDQYLEHRRTRQVPDAGRADRAAPVVEAPRPRAGSAEERAARKTMDRIDKQLTRIAVQEAELNERMALVSSDHVALAELSAELAQLSAQREVLETEWLEAAEALE